MNKSHTEFKVQYLSGAMYTVVKHGQHAHSKLRDYHGIRQTSSKPPYDHVLAAQSVTRTRQQYLEKKFRKLLTISAQE